MPLSTTDLPTLGEILKDSPGWLDEAVDTAEASWIVGFPVCTLHTWRSRGEGPPFLNVFHLGWAFVFQSLTGLVLEQWPTQDGHYPLIAYQVAFGLNVALQIAALIWSVPPRVRILVSALILEPGR